MRIIDKDRAGVVGREESVRDERIEREIGWAERCIKCEPIWL